VITTRHTGGDWWTFECKGIESKQNKAFKYEMLGMLEALESAASSLPGEGGLGITACRSIACMLRGYDTAAAEEFLKKLMQPRFFQSIQDNQIYLPSLCETPKSKNCSG